MIGRIPALLFITLLSVSCNTREQVISYVRSGNRIELIGEIPSKGPLELQIRSRRNGHVSRLSDRSPDDSSGPRSITEGREIWFPVIDIELERGLSAVAEFDDVSPADRICWNGNFQQDCAPLRERAAFERNLEHWENGVFIESETAKLRDFYLRIPVADPSRQRPGFRTLTDDWAGNVRLFLRHGKSLETVASIEIPAPRFEPGVSGSPGSDQDLIGAIGADIEFLLKCRNRNPRSPTFGGLYLFYDLDAKTYRRSDWIWTWGPAIRFLIEASAVPEITRPS